MKNSNDTIGNPTRELPACSVVPQTTACRLYSGKVKVIPQQAEVAQGVPVRLRSRISLTFGTTWVVGRQP